MTDSQENPDSDSDSDSDEVALAALQRNIAVASVVSTIVVFGFIAWLIHLTK